ncbi:unnamed protein product [Acanthoscelides obtectus]|uniref:Uncharacterized protein n=1 Tax=Acanthoscelides obtectus TaxID=200917 RepID=A0A9P0Q278_ACAOB|nr:unnamed protein product [Acanthoscelides obtectus]CAK1671147.1 hypothetical protein AOBTE_LOCUS28087 [Acanthoscelides obtectus]
MTLLFFEVFSTKINTHLHPIFEAPDPKRHF